jgi:HAD superfamily hydrolase (TIGR01509 family)
MPGVIFDLDGVLIDSENLQFKAYSLVLSELGVTVSREEYGREWIAAGRGSEYAVAKYGLAITAAELRARKNPVYHRILQEEVRLMPAVVPALERLSACFPLAVATNSNAEDVNFALNRFGLRPHFRAVVTREAYDLAKPEPDAFRAAASALGLEPGQCLVVEDTHKGVVAAHRAGCRCVAVPHDFTADNDFALADRVLGSLDALSVELVRELLG